MNITANFAINTYPVNVSASGNGNVAKNPDQVSYNYHTIVQLNATAATGWHFTGWSGDLTGMTNPVSVYTDSTLNITANFTINTYPLNISVSGNGTATKTPDQPSYNYHTSVQLAAASYAGWYFTGWSGDVTGMTNPISVNVDSVMNVGANFALINTYSLNISVAGSGTVTKIPDQISYAYHTSVQLSAVPAAGWHFTGWSGALSGTANPLSVNVDSNINVTAHFAESQFSLDVSSAGSGTVTKQPDQASYSYHASVQLTAIPDTGWYFTGWSGAVTGTSNPLSVNVDSTMSAVAHFEAITHSLNLSVTGNGTATKYPDLISYGHHASVELRAVPATGWHFTGWSGALTGTANPFSVNVDSNMSVTASFAINSYSLTVSAIGNGTATKTPDQALYEYHMSVQLRALPAEGWHFSRWGGAITGSANPIDVNVDSLMSVQAEFAINTYVIVASSGTHGSISPSDTVYLPYGGERRFTFNPDPGYSTDTLYVNSEAVDSTMGYTFTDVKMNQSIHVTFKPIRTTVQLSISGGWNIVSLPVIEGDPRKSVLFPTSISPAYLYQAKYVARDSLKNGAGYWLKFSSPENVSMTGIPLEAETVEVEQGWNIIGSISEKIPVHAITSIPPGIATSNFYGYLASYQPTDTVYPGKGYWVKAEQAGDLILSSSLSKSGLISINLNSGLPPPPPDVALSGMNEVPQAFGLEQNYPNPLNPTTLIRYQLPVDSRVKLEVYNLLGEMVASLVDGVQDAGYKSMEFSGSSLASGVYFYRLEAISIADPANTFTQLRKMALIK